MADGLLVHMRAIRGRTIGEDDRVRALDRRPHAHHRGARGARRRARRAPGARARAGSAAHVQRTWVETGARVRDAGELTARTNDEDRGRTMSTRPRPTRCKRRSTDANVISGGHLVAKALKAEGIDVIFTLCGGHIIDIYDGCIDEGIKVIDVRHEQVAAHAADGYARMTGKPGCAVVTAGPGTHRRRDRRRQRLPRREPDAADRRPGRARTSTRWARCRTCRTST